jgi:hypothetical protein
MKHIVTLSLVFFSLSQLAHAERVEGLKLFTEGYCNKSSGAEISNLGASQTQQYKGTFLVYNELTLSEALFQANLPKYQVFNHLVADLTIRKKPKNNSP